MTHKILVIPHQTTSGLRYEVCYEGEMLVKSSRQPLFAAARILQERGLTGELEMYGPPENLAPDEQPAKRAKPGQRLIQAAKEASEMVRDGSVFDRAKKKEA